MKASTLKEFAVNVLLTLIAVVLTLSLMEGLAQFWVYYIARQGKIIRPDPVLGWDVKAGLDITRLNADGNVWVIKTDRSGIRGTSFWPPNSRKVLVLGDSFAFGEGVNLEHRFDAIIAANGFSVINLGVMGYGTDQELLKAHPYLSSLNHDDIVILLTGYYDFWDIARKTHSGRVKPWYEIKHDVCIRHDPNISFMQIFRDKSYLFSKIAAWAQRHEHVSLERLQESADVYTRLVLQLANDLNERGTRLLVAIHGLGLIADKNSRQIIDRALTKVCDSTYLRCLLLDNYFSESDRKIYFLKDSHWNDRGHQRVGNILSAEIIRMFPVP